MNPIDYVWRHNGGISWRRQTHQPLLYKSTLIDGDYVILWLRLSENLSRSPNFLLLLLDLVVGGYFTKNW